MIDLRMPDINNVIIAGNLTRDPTFRKTTNGTPVANFWIASNRKFKDNVGQWRENVCYVGIVAWYKLAENCSENLHKGSAVIVEGELQSRSVRFEDGRNRNIVEIKARRIQFLNRKESDEEKLEFAEDYHGHENEAMSEMEDDSNLDSFEESSEMNSNTSENAEENPNKGKYDFGYQDIEI